MLQHSADMQVVKQSITSQVDARTKLKDAQPNPYEYDDKRHSR